jgi:prepilin-type N-terminal cleavage/methylation domain-containing protein/prepilin-type processing-associated H-X9-DG protein
MRTPFRYSTDSHRAFTLVELLVVIAIIAVLTALAVPAVGGALESSQRSKCASNMKSIGAGIHLYAAENNGKLPGTHHGGTNYWINELRGPLGRNYDRIRISPVDPKGPQRLAQGGTSYVMNARVNPEAFANEFGEIDPGEVVYDKLSRIPAPSRAILLFLASTNKGTAPSEDHICGDIMSWSGFRKETWPDAYGGTAGGDGTIGQSNYLFADGHVQTIPAAEVKARIDAGKDVSQSFP